MTQRKGPDSPWPNEKDFYRLTARIADALERIADELEAQRATREESPLAQTAEPAQTPTPGVPPADVRVELGPPNTQEPLRTSYPPGSAAEALEGLKRLRTLQAQATGSEETEDVFTDNPFAPRFGRVPREIS
ncbi:MAG TPA: hypothetical protein VMS12_00820 [Thermoanaerobaculia bacterium]|nr:hypothetical protein [Thermoanaerobaculia bacterium]